MAKHQKFDGKAMDRLSLYVGNNVPVDTPVRVGDILGVTESASFAGTGDVDNSVNGMVSGNAPGWATVCVRGSWLLEVDTTSLASTSTSACGQPVYMDSNDALTTDAGVAGSTVLFGYILQNNVAGDEGDRIHVGFGI